MTTPTMSKKEALITAMNMGYAYAINEALEKLATLNFGDELWEEITGLLMGSDRYSKGEKLAAEARAREQREHGGTH